MIKASRLENFKIFQTNVVLVYDKSKGMHIHECTRSRLQLTPGRFPQVSISSTHPLVLIVAYFTSTPMKKVRSSAGVLRSLQVGRVHARHACKKSTWCQFSPVQSCSENILGATSFSELFIPFRIPFLIHGHPLFTSSMSCCSQAGHLPPPGSALICFFGCASPQKPRKCHIANYEKHQQRNQLPLHAQYADKNIMSSTSRHKPLMPSIRLEHS